MFYNKTLLEELGDQIQLKTTHPGRIIEISKQVYEKTGYRANLIHYGMYGSLVQEPTTFRLWTSSAARAR